MYKESHQKKLKLSLKYIQHQLRHSRLQGKVSLYTIPKWILVYKRSDSTLEHFIYLSDVTMTTPSLCHLTPLRTSCEPPEML